MTIPVTTAVHARLARLSSYLQARIDDVTFEGVILNYHVYKGAQAALNVIQLAKEGDMEALLAASNIEVELLSHAPTAAILKGRLMNSIELHTTVRLANSLARSAGRRFNREMGRVIVTHPATAPGYVEVEWESGEWLTHPISALEEVHGPFKPRWK